MNCKTHQHRTNKVPVFLPLHTCQR